jgi:hypothetical protein
MVKAAFVLIGATAPLPLQDEVRHVTSFSVLCGSLFDHP